MNSVVIFTFLYLLFALCPCNHASVLSTFQPEKLRIRVEHRKDSTIISEAIMLLQNHFIRKHQFSRKDWDILRKELGQYEDPHRAVRELIARVNDPYGKFIEVKPMKRTQQNIRGVGVGTGLTLRRTWHLEHLKYALIRVLLPWQRQGALHTVDTQVVNIADNGNKTLLRSLHRIGDYIATCSLAVLPSAGLLWKGSPSKRLLWVLSSTLFFTFFVATKVYPWIRPIEVVSILHPTNENNVRVGDKIVSINQKEVGLRSIKRINKVMNNGEVGEMVDIEVLRTSETSLFTLHKTKLVKDFVPQTKIDHFALLKNRLGYIAIKEFNEESFRDFTKAFDELKNEIKENSGESMQGVVIDLRGNPGGTMVSALDIAALFLRRGSTLTQLSFNGRVEQCKSKNGKADLVTPILLLVDSLTASASEILVEALCDNERASSAGVKTVGKNLAQAIINLCDGSGFCFTVREFLTPRGRSMRGGHMPSFPISRPQLLNIEDISLSANPNIRWQIPSE